MVEIFALEFASET